jgi:hypothetical protein
VRSLVVSGKTKSPGAAGLRRHYSQRQLRLGTDFHNAQAHVGHKKPRIANSSVRRIFSSFSSIAVMNQTNMIFKAGFRLTRLSGDALIRDVPEAHQIRL